MDNLVKEVLNINSLSKEILSELHKEEPSFADIQNMMSKRQVMIDSFGEELKFKKNPKIADKTNALLKTHLDEFLEINENIKEVISRVLNRNRSDLNTAKKQRKAEESYTFFS